MKICLIVINFNGIYFLNKYLNDLNESCEINKIDLIVTDDQSTDDSKSYLIKNNYIFTINQNKKRGFASNVNCGIRFAQSLNSYDFLIIANNDIEIGKGFFEFALPKALNYITNKDNLSRIIGFDEVLEDRTDYFENFNFQQYDATKSLLSTSIPGFFFLIDKRLLNEIGYLDEEYFMYGEDNDYFIRTLKGGFKIYNTLLPIRHYSEGSSTNYKATSWFVYRNALLYAQKNLGFWGIFKMLLSFLWKIYYPFYKSKGPSDYRIIRCGFMINNYLLLKSLIWNINYFLNKYRINGK